MTEVPDEEEVGYDIELDDPKNFDTGYEDDSDALNDEGEDDNSIPFEVIEDDEDDEGDYEEDEDGESSPSV
jgi:hypothetical protein